MRYFVTTYILLTAYEWVSYSHDDVPVNAVKGGYDCDGYDIFIGKVYYHGEMPCKLVPDRKQSYVSFNGREHSVDGCEVKLKETCFFKSTPGTMWLKYRLCG